MFNRSITSGKPATEQIKHYDSGPVAVTLLVSSNPAWPSDVLSVSNVFFCNQHTEEVLRIRQSWCRD
ncbi:hypothetical protein DPMN_055907 [Dreissena polymorpha]|uniref:Uncharacterized protein n=1 Tax=Dreissena polymorpha TaxID=45954 RepID=A0A9D4CSG2_DREPO|nr:hypothetical protein DPMN_055907 [Dreissena polymorpha]